MSGKKSKNKGGTFERQICKELSMWWTDGKRDDVFWRTAASGARATARQRRTAGGFGDVCAADPIGEPLLDLFTIELKTGYSDKTIIDCLDKREGAARQQYEEWFEQAYQDHQQSGSYTWMIIAKRNQRVPMVYVPWSVELLDLVEVLTAEVKTDKWAIHMARLEEFFEIDPQYFKNLQL